MDADIEERKQKLKDDYEMSVITLEQFTQGIVQLAVSLSWLWHTVDICHGNCIATIPGTFDFDEAINSMYAT